MLKSLKRTRVVFNYKHQLLKHSKPEIVNLFIYLMSLPTISLIKA